MNLAWGISGVLFWDQNPAAVPGWDILVNSRWRCMTLLDGLETQQNLQMGFPAMASYKCSHEQGGPGSQPLAMCRPDLCSLDIVWCPSKDKGRHPDSVP